jgi:hypothetical protein
VKNPLRASRPTIGRVKNQATTTSRSVERPRKKAKPRTGPTVNQNRRAAPMKLEMSAARMVRNARAKERSVELRSVRPARSSSLRRSKYTT